MPFLINNLIKFFWILVLKSATLVMSSIFSQPKLLTSLRLVQIKLNNLILSTKLLPQIMIHMIYRTFILLLSVTMTG